MATRQRRLTGYPVMSDQQLDVLRMLRDAAKADRPFIHLAGVHKRTLRALIEHDLIFESPGLDGVRYKITGRGVKTLAAYERPTRRSDGLCPRCGERPRRIRKRGKHKGEPGPYCVECERRIYHRNHALGLLHLNPETPCSRCKKRPRHVYPSGKMITYCYHCRSVLRKRERRRKMKRKLARIAAGELIKCLKCDQPVYHTDRTVYDYCHTHYRAYMTEYNDRRRADSQAALQRKAS